MKIAIGGISHETNTFNIVPTSLDAFRSGRGRMYYGEEMIHRLDGTNTVIGGFIEASRQHNLSLTPTFFAEAPPTTGTVSREAFEFMENELLRGVQGANIEGILLNLHGAMVAEGYDDPEGHVLKKVRESVRKDTPIVLVHDFHGNLSREWIDNASAIIGYKTAPHTDMGEMGREGGRVIAEILDGKVKPAMAMEKPSILIGGGLMTVVDTPLDVIKSPLFWTMSRAKEMEKESNVINATVMGGFGHADVPRGAWAL